MRKTVASLVVMGAMSGGSISAQSSLPAVDVTAADIRAFVAALPRDAVSDRPIRVVDVGGYRIGVYGVSRPQAVPGEAVLHDTTITEVYYMLSGTGTLITGGTLVDAVRPATTAPPGAMVTVRGSRIEGGTSRRVVPGDVIIIPAGVPHWWSRLDGDITYLIVRPDPDAKLTLK